MSNYFIILLEIQQQLKYLINHLQTQVCMFPFAKEPST